MAQIRQQSHADPDSPRAVLALTIRPWARVAVNERVRLVLGDSECAARAAVWVEIGYRVEEAPLTYVRHILEAETWRCAEETERLLRGESPYAIWRSGCPPALLMARPGAADAQGEPTFQLTLQLTLGGLSDSGEPDASGLTLSLDRVNGRELLRFGEAFDRELRAALEDHGRAAPAPDLAVNTFSSRVNSAAYDALGEAYAHDYLAEPFFRKAFEGWLGQMPAGGRVLEVGCGHGEPVAAALAAAGLRVTGIDPSGEMIELARARAAGEFRQMALAELEEAAAFDGACCFFSLLCMDPIELRVGLERLHRALKADAPLLIVSGVPDLYTRTSPLRTVQGRTTWEWTYDHEDMAAILQERGQWRVGTASLRYYDTDTLQPVGPDELEQATDFSGRTVKGVYALIARKKAVGSGP
ncbi:MAG: class I SAM-dependent methyltransferase [Caldilineaceae bacterium]|nr:class I SAM-dependent methyltransferase [Caldilineaceae bacterium]